MEEDETRRQVLARAISLAGEAVQTDEAGDADNAVLLYQGAIDLIASGLTMNDENMVTDHPNELGTAQLIEFSKVYSDRVAMLTADGANNSARKSLNVSPVSRYASDVEDIEAQTPTDHACRKFVADNEYLGDYDEDDDHRDSFTAPGWGTSGEAVVDDDQILFAPEWRKAMWASMMMRDAPPVFEAPELPSMMQKRSSFLQRVDESVNTMMMMDGSPQAECGGQSRQPGPAAACSLPSASTSPRTPGSGRLDHDEMASPHKDSSRDGAGISTMAVGESSQLSPDLAMRGQDTPGRGCEGATSSGRHGLGYASPEGEINADVPGQPPAVGLPQSPACGYADLTPSSVACRVQQDHCRSNESSMLVADHSSRGTLRDGYVTGAEGEWDLGMGQMSAQRPLTDEHEWAIGVAVSAGGAPPRPTSTNATIEPGKDPSWLQLASATNRPCSDGVAAAASGSALSTQFGCEAPSSAALGLGSARSGGGSSGAGGSAFGGRGLTGAGGCGGGERGGGERGGLLDPQATPGLTSDGSRGGGPAATWLGWFTGSSRSDSSIAKSSSKSCALPDKAEVLEEGSLSELSEVLRPSECYPGEVTSTRMLGTASAGAARQAAGLISGTAPTSHAPRTGGTWFKDPKRLPPASPLPPPSGAATAAAVAAKAKVEEAKRSRSQRKQRECREGKDTGGKEGDQFLKKDRSHRRSKEPKDSAGAKDKDRVQGEGSDSAAGVGAVADAPSATKPVPLSKVPTMGSLCDLGGLLEAAPKMADGSSMVVPDLKFQHGRAENAAKRQAEVSGLSLLVQAPDECPLPAVFLFFSEDPYERAALVIQHYARAWLERRMVRYLLTMRRLVLLLATRERKAARLIRERWLTKVILERNSNRLRPLLEALLGSVCIDKPDRLLDYATEWMRTNFPVEAEEAASSDCRCMWSPRDDIEPTQDALMGYLDETNATTILEGIIERAISAQPENVHAYVIDELVAQNPDILLESDEECSDEEVGDFGELAAEEEDLAQEELEEEEEALLEEETVLLEMEELDVEEEALELVEEEAELEADEAEFLGISHPTPKLPPGQCMAGLLGTLTEEPDAEGGEPHW